MNEERRLAPSRSSIKGKRVDDEDEEIMVGDQAVERLVIVTQNSRMSEGQPAEESKTISSELASAINDGLYFYEQELNLKRSHRRHNEPINKSRDENPRSSANDASALNSRTLDHSIGGSSLEVAGNSNVQRKQHKGSSEPHSIYKQQLFTGNFREGASAKGITEEYSCPTSSTACPKRRKRKTKRKTEYSDTEVSVPQRIRLRGRVRCRDNNNTITDERGELDSATFLHYFMHIWNAFPEEKVNFVTYFDPLWFDLYAGENSRARVLNWIKEKAIFSKKYVLVPIVMWSHWSLLILCHLGECLHSETNTRCMLLLDSLHAVGPTRLEPLIRRLLFDVHKSEERVVSRQELQKIPLLIPKVPQQKKGEECGFYVLYYIRLFLENAPENFSISKGYPYFMKNDWFSVESVESFCKSLDAFRPLILSDDDEDDGGDSVVFIGTKR